MELFCPWESAQYFVYSSNIPTLFFYSHIPAILVAMLVGMFVFYKTNKSKLGASLLLVTTLFSLWSIFDLFIWATNRPDVVLFYWSLQILIEPLVYLLSFYLVYLFVKNKDLDFKWKLVSMVLYSPVIFLLASNFNLIGVDIGYCNAVEGPIAQYYTYIVEGLFIIAIILLILLEYRKIDVIARKKEIVVFSLGVILFLIAFSSGNVIGSFTENWNLAQAGLIGMPIFVAFLAYMIVRFKTFNIKMIGTQVLIFSLGFLVLGILFIRRIENVRIVVIFTLLFVTATGYLLVRSVKKEIEQKEELAKLIEQRESLVHLVTHKVKGSFTRSKYIFAEMLDGTFGEISPEVKKYAQIGLESDKMGISTVDLVLNADNLTKGVIKYNMQPMDFRDLVTKLIEEKKAPALAKGLQLDSDISDGSYNMSGDTIWIREAINNLIENSIRYTKKGEIKIELESVNGKIKFKITDTGVGITPEDKKNLFTQGGRGANSVKINVDSTGYGLYSVKLIIEAHKGRVWVESEGQDKGSTFFVELPTIA